MSSTPFDDAFKTILHDCRGLVLPLLNELFSENYTGEETIVFFSEENLINKPDHTQEKRIADSNFAVISEKTKHYHLECQSKEDNRILIRIFEYDAEIALENAVFDTHGLKLSFPHSALIYLRCKEEEPDEMFITISTPGGSIRYPVPVMKIRSYSLQDIFDKNLLFLLPFYIFNFEKDFKFMKPDSENYHHLLQDYSLIRQKLDILNENGNLNYLSKTTLLEMAQKVLESLTEHYTFLKEGALHAMGGHLILTESMKNYTLGISQGISQGKELLLIELSLKKMLKGKSPTLIAEELEENLSLIQRICNVSRDFAPDYDVNKIFQALHSNDINQL